MRLAVGMPVHERAWALPLWFDSLEAQKLVPKKDISLVFAYSESYDGTWDILQRRGASYGELHINTYDLPTFPSRQDLTRFTTLAQLRNALLNMVKETDADYYLSWDNDVLFPPKELRKLFIEKDAVGALIDMGGQDNAMMFPSVMNFGRTQGEVAFRRPWSEYPHDEPFKCDIIMAVKLMTREVYSNTDYRWDPTGEDIGWCYSCEEKGYERWLQPNARGIHLYDGPAAVRCLKKHSGLKYPEVLEPLKTWYLEAGAASN